MRTSGLQAHARSDDARRGSPPVSAELSPEQFRRISDLLYGKSGIFLQAGKEQLVKSRLQKRLIARGLPGYSEYFELLEGPQGSAELSLMVEALTTNKTSFFREPEHFAYLSERILPQLGDTIRIWSAGCSTGEEPYSLAITCREKLPDLSRRDARILATDLAGKVLRAARAGIYGQEDVADIPSPLLRKYFTERSGGGSRTYQAQETLRELIRFAQLNLMAAWPMTGPFDLILCRNVMIYFDKKTQENLVQRFWELLRPGGHLFTGHAESLTGLDHHFHYLKPAVYQK